MIKFTLAQKQALSVAFSVSVLFGGGGGGEPYTGKYTVNPTFGTQTLETKDKHLRDNVTVQPIEVSRVSNPAGGKTIFIGGTTNG